MVLQVFNFSCAGMIFSGLRRFLGEAAGHKGGPEMSGRGNLPENRGPCRNVCKNVFLLKNCHDYPL